MSCFIAELFQLCEDTETLDMLQANKRRNGTTAQGLNGSTAQRFPLPFCLYAFTPLRR
jgi:hypothetical protein